jgi:hypothetical protein
MSLTATERLNRWGAAKTAPAETLKPSIAAMRRMSATGLAADQAVAPAPIDQVLASDSIEAAVAAPSTGAPVDETTSSGFGQTIEAMNTQLRKIVNSVEFTEAYVAVGMTKSIGEMLAKEIAMAERLGAMRAQYRSRQRGMLLVILALLALLVVEVQLPFLGAFTADAAAFAFSAVDFVWQGALRAFSSLSAFLPH